jgi:RNA polymerase sigma factor (sigma-70 family)
MNEIYKKDLSKFSKLSINEEIRLAKEAKEGSLKSRNKLIESNLKFAFSVAKRYQNSKVPLEDLVAAANEGLIKAVEKYDHTRGMKFITYSFHWIKASIMELLKNSDVVRTPEEKANAIVTSIDEPVGEDLYLYETLEYHGEYADMDLHKSDFRKHLYSMIDNYPQKTKDVLDGYYQVYNEFATINEVASKYNMSLEGIRKIKNKAINELKLKLEY